MTDLNREERIVWDEDISGLDYVRVITVAAYRRRHPIPWRGDGRRVGYAALKPDAPHDDGQPGTFTRRLFFLKDHDRDTAPNGPYRTGAPIEAVDPRTVAPGVAGTENGRVWGKEV